MRQFANRRGNIRLWAEPRDQLLDLALGGMARRVEERPVILFIEVGRQQADRRQRDVSAFEPLEDERKAPCRPRRGDACIGRGLREAQHPSAVVEQRRTALAPKEPARVDFNQRRDQGGSRFPFFRGEPLHRSDQLEI